MLPFSVMALSPSESHSHSLQKNLNLQTPRELSQGILNFFSQILSQTLLWWFSSGSKAIHHDLLDQAQKTFLSFNFEITSLSARALVHSFLLQSCRPHSPAPWKGLWGYHRGRMEQTEGLAKEPTVFHSSVYNWNEEQMLHLKNG